LNLYKTWKSDLLINADLLYEISVKIKDSMSNKSYKILNSNSEIDVVSPKLFSCVELSKRDTFIELVKEAMDQLDSSCLKDTEIESLT
jgi:hypothetical protein